MPARVGVLAGERQSPQAIEVDLTLHCHGDPGALDDDLGRTPDYAALDHAVRQLALARHRDLIETLAADIRQLAGAFHPSVAAVGVEVRKFILPHTGSVAVRLPDADAAAARQ